MAKKPAPLDDKKVKVLQLVRPDGNYAYVEYEISEHVLKTEGVVISKTEPDLYAVCLTQITKISRELFEI